MKLLIIHGAPAVGKLTISRSIAERTGFKVFHNHVSIDCVKPVFEFGSRPFSELITKIRLETFRAAARENVDVIHTFCYAKGPDDEQFREFIATVEDNGGEVNCVLLTCDDEVRRHRIVAEERRQIGKLTDPDSIDTLREEFDLSSPLPGRETLTINTSNISPIEAASKIIGHYSLKEIEE